MNIESIGGRDQSQVKNKSLKSSKKVSPFRKHIPKCHNDDKSDVVRSLEGLESRFVFRAFLGSFTSFGRISNDTYASHEGIAIEIRGPGGSVNRERVGPFCVWLVVGSDVLELSEL